MVVVGEPEERSPGVWETSEPQRMHEHSWKRGDGNVYIIHFHSHALNRTLLEKEASVQCRLHNTCITKFHISTNLSEISLNYEEILGH